jgi:hypothetical protein
LCFISIYQVLILNKILSIHVLVVPVASPQCKALVVARTHACRFDAHEIINYVCIFSDVYNCFSNNNIFKYVTVF